MKPILILLSALCCFGCGIQDAGKSVANTSVEETGACRANLQTIANSIQTARATSRSADYSPFFGSVDSSKEPDMQAVPVCPSGGSYSVEEGSSGSNMFKVRCSKHGTFEPGVDFK